jgi:hypothetical protein
MPDPTSGDKTMSAPSDSADPPMAEPGKRPSGADVGGPHATTTSGVADWAQRSTEQRDETSRPASSESARGNAAAGGAAAQRGPKRGDAQTDDDEEEWRHEPVAPVDETNPLRSLGKAVGDAVTGSGPDASVPPKR